MVTDGPTDPTYGRIETLMLRCENVSINMNSFVCLFNSSWQHLVVFPLAMAYLSVVNIRRMMIDYGGIVVNVTGMTKKQ